MQGKTNDRVLKHATRGHYIHHANRERVVSQTKSQIPSSIARIFKPILGMFVLICKALLMVNPNMVMKLTIFYIFYTFCDIFNMSSAHVCRVESVNIIIVT